MILQGPFVLLFPKRGVTCVPLAVCMMRNGDINICCHEDLSDPRAAEKKAGPRAANDWYAY